jgi:hypothetical protein
MTTKYVTFWEFPIENTDRAYMKWNKYIETSRKMPMKYPKFLFGPTGVGKLHEGIGIIEVENEEQLHNLLYLSPEFKLEFEPLFDLPKTFELFNKAKEEMKVEMR